MEKNRKAGQGMTSLQVQYFLKVAESMSFSKAAEELYVSQPSVSRQIQRLEEELEPPPELGST